MWVKQQQCCVLLSDVTEHILLLTPTLLCAGTRKLEQIRGHSASWQSRRMSGRAGKSRTPEMCWVGVSPGHLCLMCTPPLQLPPKICDEFHSQWLNKRVTLGGADGREVKSQKESQSGTRQRSFPVCLGPCWVVIEGVASKRFWKLFSALSSFTEAGIASVLLVALPELEEKGNGRVA